MDHLQHSGRGCKEREVSPGISHFILANSSSVFAGGNSLQRTFIYMAFLKRLSILATSIYFISFMTSLLNPCLCCVADLLFPIIRHVFWFFYRLHSTEKLSNTTFSEWIDEFPYMQTCTSQNCRKDIQVDKCQEVLNASSIVLSSSQPCSFELFTEG